jgi:pantothenate kinase
MTQHGSLSPERWAAFSRDQQLLMIANEMNRASSLTDAANLASFRRCYERVLRLVDLTVEVNASSALRRELLRWRELAAAIFIAPGPSLAEHRELFRALLLLNPQAAKQIPFVLG